MSPPLDWLLLPITRAAPRIVGDRAGRSDMAVAGELHTTAEWFDFIFGGMHERREERSERRRRPRSERPKKAVGASCRPNPLSGLLRSTTSLSDIGTDEPAGFPPSP